MSNDCYVIGVTNNINSILYVCSLNSISYKTGEFC